MKRGLVDRFLEFDVKRGFIDRSLEFDVKRVSLIGP